MSINQISTANTFGQLVTAVSAIIAVANNFTDGPQSQTDSTWTFTNSGVGVNVPNTALFGTANAGTLNASTGNITGLTVGTANISTANITVANVGGATIGNVVVSSRITTTNANVNFIQVDDRANIFSLNAETANIGTLALTSLSVASLTVPVLNASFANMTSGFANTFQAISLIATLATVTNANVSLLNSSSANLTGATIGTLNVSLANLTTVTTPTVIGTVVNTSTLNATTGNITNLTVVRINASSANLTTGTMAANPTVNLGIATKQYVDSGAGGNLIAASTFSAKGDLLVGSGANTYNLLSTGSNGQAVVVDTTQTTGLRYSDRASNTFTGLYITTSMNDRVSNATQLIVHRLDEVVMDDGEVVKNWPRTTIDLSVSGAGGLDGGTANANTWYEVYAIRQRSTGTRNFLIHRNVDRNPDQNTANLIQWPTAGYAHVLVNRTTTPNVNVAMSFTPNVTGNITSIEIRGFKNSSPTGNIWLTVRANSSGTPNSTILSTSRKYDVARHATSHIPVRFVFDNVVPVTASTSYFWTLENDFSASDTNYMSCTYSPQAANGAGGVNPGVPFGNNGSSWVNLTPGVGTFIYKVYIESNATPVTMPSGYDQKCLISHMATDHNSQIRPYSQHNRHVVTFGIHNLWMAYVPIVSGATEIADFKWHLPPITVIGHFTHTGAAQYFAVGSLNVLDAPGSFAEQIYPGIQFGHGVYSSGEFLIEQQAFVQKTGSNTYKYYVTGFQF